MKAQDCGDIALRVKGVLEPFLPEGVGFALVLFDFGEGGSMHYSSNGTRRSTARLLAELAGKLMLADEKE